jgi:hypothetical protein
VVSQIDTLIAQATDIANDYKSQLDALVTEIQEKWIASGKALEEKAPLIEEYLNKATSLQTECDSKVNAILTQISALDTARAEQGTQQYEEEKAKQILEYESRLTEAVRSIYDALSKP